MSQSKLFGSDQNPPPPPLLQSFSSDLPIIPMEGAASIDRQTTRWALKKEEKNDSATNNLPRFLPTNSTKDIKKKKPLNYVPRPNETPVQTSKDLLCLSQILCAAF